MSLARPTTLPVWATGGIVTVPSAGKQATGWEQNEAPPFDYFNWHQNLTYEWIDYLDRKIPAAPTVGYDYTSPVTGMLDISPPAGTPLLTISGSYIFSGGSTFDFSTGGFSGVMNLGEHFEKITSITTDPVTITTIDFHIKVASGTIVATVERWLRNTFGTGAPSILTVATNDAFSLSANFQIVTITLNAPIDVLSYVYRLKLVTSGNASSADIRLEAIKVNYTKTRVE